MPDAVDILGRVSPESGRTAIVCHNVSKDFGSVRALDGINLEVRAGTVHALVGENGAGKSTLLGVLAGRISPTSGTVHLFDQELPYGIPRAIRSMGVAAIYQELMIAPTLSAQSNVYLGQPIAKRGFLMEKAMRHGFDRLCARFGEQIRADVPAGTLSVAQQQLLEIMRGLVASARLILFDEPTASLPPRDREALFRVMADLRADGVTIMFVSHNLDEVLGIADVVTVFRDGRLAATAPAKEWTKSSLVAKMLGRELAVKESAEATGDQKRNTSRPETNLEYWSAWKALPYCPQSKTLTSRSAVVRSLDSEDWWVGQNDGLKGACRVAAQCQGAALDRRQRGALAAYSAPGARLWNRSPTGGP